MHLSGGHYHRLTVTALHNRVLKFTIIYTGEQNHIKLRQLFSLFRAHRGKYTLPEQQGIPKDSLALKITLTYASPHDWSGQDTVFILSESSARTHIRVTAAPFVSRASSAV